MKEKTKLILLDVIMVFLCIIIGICITILYNNFFNPRNTFIINETEIKGVNGFYAGNEYYCVVTKGRTQEQIDKTDCHENCHDFVKQDYEHFCTRRDILGYVNTDKMENEQ